MAVGRYFPLGHQEWRLVYTWTTDVRVYHIVALVQFVVFGAGVAAALRQMRAVARPAALFVLLAAPVLISFGTLVVPERTLLTVLPWWLASFLRWHETREPPALFANLLCVHVLLYLKEPMVVLLGSAAMLGLIEWIARSPPARAETSRWPWLEWGTLASCAAYAVPYLVKARPETFVNAQAYSGASVSIGNVGPALSMYATRDPVLLLMLAVAPLALWKGRAALAAPLVRALAAGACYVAVLLLFGLVSTYYSAPPFVLIALSLWGLAPEAWRTSRLAAAGLVASGMLGVLLAAPVFLYRHDWLERNRQLVDQLAARLPPRDRAVFVDRGEPWDVAMLAVYADRSRGSPIVFESPAAGFSCATSPHCRHRAAPAPGQLRLDLGALSLERTATIVQDGRGVWTYRSMRDRMHDSSPPAIVRRFVDARYRFW
jgi:hypothetical protein